ncbi:unnamed protein product, partial [Timema podura]|nr:unnamed protein product [Timema podura]
MFTSQVKASPVHISAAGFCIVNKSILIS